MWVDFSHTGPIKFPYGSHIALPVWVQHGTMLQIPHESLMGYPYRTHINTHLGPMWVLYFLLAGKLIVDDERRTTMDDGHRVMTIAHPELLLR